MKKKKSYCLSCHPDLDKKIYDSLMPWQIIACIKHYVKQPRKKDIKDTLGSSILITQHSNGKYAKGIARGGSRFYNPSQTLNKQIRELLHQELSVKPVKTIDPSHMTAQQLSSLDFKRALSVKYLREYKEYNNFLRVMNYKSRKYSLSEKQCDLIIAISKEIKNDLLTTEKTNPCIQSPQHPSIIDNFDQKEVGLAC